MYSVVPFSASDKAATTTKKTVIQCLTVPFSRV